MQAEYT